MVIWIMFIISVSVLFGLYGCTTAEKSVQQITYKIVESTNTVEGRNYGFVVCPDNAFPVSGGCICEVGNLRASFPNGNTWTCACEMVTDIELHVFCLEGP